MPRSSARRLASMAAGGLGRLVLLAGVLVLAATFLPSLLGYQRYVLVGHSMEPTIHKGSLVFDEIVPAAALRRGDVVTYIPPTSKEPVTHRILSISRGPHGERVYRTKGDNNASADLRPFTLKREAPGPRRLRDPLPRLDLRPARDAGGADLPDRAAGRAAGAVGALRGVAPGRRAAGGGTRAVMTRTARLLAAAAWIAASVTLALPAMRSDARFNSVSTNAARSVTADSPANYLQLYSQPTDPAGLTGYATKKSSNPLVPAATGANLSLAVALGGYKNQNTTTITRVLTLQALNPLPDGASPLTVTAALTADANTGKQPITAVAFSNLDGSGAGPTATLTAGAKRQVNLTIRTQPNGVFQGNNTLHTPTVTLRVAYPGYSGSFLSYDVPVSVWDGNGGGP
jgi:hypothetical protein